MRVGVSPCQITEDGRDELSDCAAGRTDGGTQPGEYHLVEPWLQSGVAVGVDKVPVIVKGTVLPLELRSARWTGEGPDNRPHRKS